MLALDLEQLVRNRLEPSDPIGGNRRAPLEDLLHNAAWIDKRRHRFLTLSYAQRDRLFE